MIWLLLATHCVVCLFLAVAGNRLGRIVFVLAALPSLAASVWGSLQLVSDKPPAESSLVWVDGLSLSFTFQISPIASLMTVIISGIGVCVFIYSFGYFSKDSPGLGKFSATLLLFSTSMLGLVWSDSVWTLFVFWELTSITSFLLIGHKNMYAQARLSARRALLITASGGLCLLAGLLIISDNAGTSRLSEMSSTGSVSVAALLIMVAAATKSAQFPFHVWLPGAMAAPTPVSAYLHSATMVKAGVVIAALFSPIFIETEVWKYLGLFFGVISMLWGAIGALRQFDAKLILAWGTVSQLGLMFTLLSLGNAKATFAAIAIVVAHAVFKAALFMVVGEIDVRAGTRDIRELSGLAKSMPLAFLVAIVSAASMAGVPPLLGFAAKEAAIEAALGLSGLEAWLIGGSIVFGSALTVAYTLRFLLGVFTTKKAVDAISVKPASFGLSLPSAFLGLCSLVGFIFLPLVSGWVSSASVQINQKADVYQLYRWPGLTEAFLLSVAIVIVGSFLGWKLEQIIKSEAKPLGAELADSIISTVLNLAKKITGKVQHGSLPLYVTTMALTASLATIPFFFALDLTQIYWADNWAQIVLVMLILGSSFTVVTLRSRLGAAISLGFVGLCVTGLFVAHGAPDLALTQLLVETVIVVGFVIGLGKLAHGFPSVVAIWRGARLLVSAFVGVAVMVSLLSSASSPTGVPPIADLVEKSKTDGGGNNVVNVILTDIRVLDTLAEITVLVVVGIGILALAKSKQPRSVRERAINQESVS